MRVMLPSALIPQRICLSKVAVNKGVSVLSVPSDRCQVDGHGCRLIGARLMVTV